MAANAPSGLNILEQLFPVPGDFSVGIGFALISGGAAGAHTVTGIKNGAHIICACEIATSTSVWTDLTSEFSVTADDTIDNTGGTATTGDQLFVLYANKSDG